ncbi:hypothetical protein AMAG_00783 [Allomyces macrogynus ATCC 38327]|uniref:Mitochondrial resolvase Ydc2 catalytic domain-containing protein n=1 Tax=Allomyces macrogynus (strain ATCC 38327) TaxID=578462 RepID=A0A0L0RWV6_ALLM3|nr:hypothetical protein AMAG_00783 [Allomyces macrogynus ATCC 38327]|eukprot:KNE54833.1 hypothetical protein AMAG_00783 [Allomyces macrogynus ATCC 38327]
MTSVPTSLTRLTVPDLKHLCKSAGVVGLPTRKAEIAAKLTSHLHATAQRGTVPRIVSIDVGFRNLAWAYLHGSELRAWQRVTLVPAADDATAEEAATERVYDPRVFAVSVHELVAKIDAEIHGVGDAAGATPRPVATGAAATDGQVQYVIERQRMVGVGKASFSVFMVNMVEGMLWSSLTQPVRLAAVEVPVLTSLPPGAVSKWFEHGGDKKKHSATNLTKALLASRFIEEVDSPSPLTTDASAQSLKIPSVLVRQFHLEKKKDDLADALLQALAVADWTANSVHLARLHGIMASDAAAAAAPSTWQQAMAELA